MNRNRQMRTLQGNDGKVLPKWWPKVFTMQDALKVAFPIFILAYLLTRKKR